MALRSCRGCGELEVRIWPKVGGGFEYYCGRFDVVRENGVYSGSGPSEKRDGCWKGGEETMVRVDGSNGKPWGWAPAK